MFTIQIISVKGNVTHRSDKHKTNNYLMSSKAFYRMIDLVLLSQARHRWWGLMQQDEDYLDGQAEAVEWGCVVHPNVVAVGIHTSSLRSLLHHLSSRIAGPPLLYPTIIILITFHHIIVSCYNKFTFVLNLKDLNLKLAYKFMH